MGILTDDMLSAALTVPVPVALALTVPVALALPVPVSFAVIAAVSVAVTWIDRHGGLGKADRFPPGRGAGRGWPAGRGSAAGLRAGGDAAPPSCADRGEAGDAVTGPGVDANPMMLASTITTRAVTATQA